MRKLLPLMMLLLAVDTMAQKREYIDDKDEIQRRAIAELDTAMQGPEGFLYKAVIKEDLTGRFKLQVSLSDKGDIRSVQVLDREGGDIRSQNRFKDLVHQARFSTFKTPKGKQYRIEHTFDLDALRN
ncbi:MAG: hypothetical protein KIT10_04100 [Flavobacteriales bacterium]|nr:hypothetical protein [Flavobacteriales bacterium]